MPRQEASRKPLHSRGLQALLHGKSAITPPMKVLVIPVLQAKCFQREIAVFIVRRRVDIRNLRHRVYGGAPAKEPGLLPTPRLRTGREVG